MRRGTPSMFLRRSASRITEGSFRPPVVLGAAPPGTAEFLPAALLDSPEPLPPNCVLTKTCAAEESLSRMPVWAAAPPATFWACATLALTKKAQLDAAASFTPKKRCPASAACTSPLAPTNVGLACSVVFAISAPLAADASGSLSLFCAAELPLGSQAEPAFVSAVNDTTSPAARSTPVSVQVCVPEIVNE